MNSVAAGSSTTGWSVLKQYISNNGRVPTEVMMTGFSGEATHLAREAVKLGYEMVVAVGGDGTVNEVVNGLYQDGAAVNDGPVLAILPLGSGCDLARTLRIPGRLPEALKVLETGCTKRVDVGRAEFLNLTGGTETRLFINIADLGGGGLVVQKANKAPRILGRRPNYLWGIVSAALSYKARAVEVSIDGGTAMELCVRNLIIANGRYFGRGFFPAPGALMDDGLFDIVNVGNFGTVEGLRHVLKLRRGTHLSLDKVSFFQGRSVKATSEEEVLLEMDGELVGMLPASFEIIPGAVNLLVS